MVWDIAAGVIIGGVILGALRAGVVALYEAERGKDDYLPALIGIVMALGAAAWVVFFKAHLWPVT